MYTIIRKADILFRRSLILILLLVFSGVIFASSTEWYTQGKTFKPKTRVEIVLKNTMDSERINCPVIIKRESFPLPDVHEMWVTVVDPGLPSAPAPDAETLRIYGGHQMREEKNGHAIFHQLDDIDKDGIWDELVFITNFKAHEEKVIYVYIGENSRGWNKHYTHANIGSYCRHLMPFWETEYVGWKIWFANAVDVFAKRQPVLMSHELYIQNLDGYGVSAINPDWGSDIQSVARSFGAGAVCLFEDPEVPDSASTPRFTPVQAELPNNSLWNAGQISDTRYAYEVVVNGPLRSMIKIKTLNWNTLSGSYAYEQYYTVYAHQHYCHSKVVFTEFNPKHNKVDVGCGLRKKPEESLFVQEDGVIITAGPEGIRDPELIDDRKEYIVDFIGGALAVKQEYKPQYRFLTERDGNHAFSVTPDKNNSFEYLLFAAWSEGPLINDFDNFQEYTLDISEQFNTPITIGACAVEHRLK